MFSWVVHLKMFNQRTWYGLTKCIKVKVDEKGQNTDKTPLKQDDKRMKKTMKIR
jgi:hypothetical protein